MLGIQQMYVILSAFAVVTCLVPQKMVTRLKRGVKLGQQEVVTVHKKE